MKKYQVTIHFEMDDDFTSLVPSHRVYINTLIEKGIIDQYVVSMESQRVWITFTAEDKDDVENYLKKSPLHKYWNYEIDELFVVDGQHYRLPAVRLN
jgi:muconolactone delta-isomerase